MPKEYIARDAAIIGLAASSLLPHQIDDAAEALQLVPAADVVEVVRCRECKHSIMHKFPYNYEKVLACNDPHGVTIRAVKPMHFCSYGERKDGGQDDG